MNCYLSTYNKQYTIPNGHFFLIPNQFWWYKENSMMKWYHNCSIYDESDQISSHSLSLTSFFTKTGGRTSHFIADKSKISQLVSYNHNDFYLNKGSPPPDNITTVPPKTYNPPSVPFHKNTSFMQSTHASWKRRSTIRKIQPHLSTTTSPPHPTILSHPFSLMINSIKILMMLFIWNSYLIL